MPLAKKSKTTSLELSREESLILAMLVGLGASSFDAPGGPAYKIKRRLEEQNKFLVTTDDITKILEKIKKATEETK